MPSHRVEVVVLTPEGEIGRVGVDLPTAPAGSSLPDAALEIMVRQAVARAAGAFPLANPAALRRARGELR